MKSTSDIRRDFLEFFTGHGHRVVPSASLVPGNDPTLLFTNAGMVPFKDVFLGAEKRSYTRAASSQRCLRAGGKHNDLDQVGYTARHHTFFEMLGNFSFGDYFKRDAIKFAWSLLTDVWGLPAERLLVTIYATDDEAFDIWHREIGVPADRIIRIGDNKGAPYASDNFWQMADTGPCGPCTEIFYDHGPDHAGGPPGSADEDGDRFIEIWNLVFMQFDRQPDGTLAPLPAPCVDTGMGLERIAAVLQHVHSNYQIDLLQSLINAAAKAIGTDQVDHPSLKVVADHVRACAFLIADGVLPSNEGRGYVLRRIIRRALRHGWKLGRREPFFASMVAPLVASMGDAYPELAQRQPMIEATLSAEETRFAETLDQGMRVFDQVAAASQGTIAGEDLFRLYDTFGFPVDLTADIARERGLSVDHAGFETAMAQQRDRARGASQFAGAITLPADLASKLESTRFCGYDCHRRDATTVVGLIADGRSVDRIDADTDAIVLLSETPFYAESGGQVGDSGMIGDAFAVTDTIKLGGVFHGHVGRLKTGSLAVGAEVTAAIDEERRCAVVLNHTATHLLHAALRDVLGEHVEQKGSLVAPDRLRFDFSHHGPVTRDELAEVERRVNAEIRANHGAEVRNMAYQEAIEFGAMALFGEKYGDEVRVLRFGPRSTELCGGTHVERTGDIGAFKITSESGISAGIRRIEAVTGADAVDRIQDQEQRLGRIAGLVGGGLNDIEERVSQLLDRAKRAERELDRARSQSALDAAATLDAAAQDVGGLKVVAKRLDGVDAKSLRDAVDRLKQQLGDAVILLASSADGRVALVAGVHGRALESIKAGDVVAHVAAQIDGRGGGRADMAQGGGVDSPKLDAALQSLPAYIAANAIP